MNTVWERLTGDEDGATLVEYALLLGLIALAAVAGVSMLGTKISGKMGTLWNAWP